MADTDRNPGECLTLGGHVYERDNKCFHCGKEAPPGPPGPPRCRDCRRVVAYRGHADDCAKGNEQKAHFENVHAVEKALSDAIRERRQDREFMARLAARIREDANILDALQSDEPGEA